jgi:hypothetical protein
MIFLEVPNWLLMVDDFFTSLEHAFLPLLGLKHCSVQFFLQWTIQLECQIPVWNHQQTHECTLHHFQLGLRGLPATEGGDLLEHTEATEGLESYPFIVTAFLVLWEHVEFDS